jgi:DNA-damage-inducible protein D
MANRQVVNQHQQTFESIRQFDEEGHELGLARQLAKVLEYSECRHFQPVIERAWRSAMNRK